jgi:hypothetical protein
MCNHKNIDGTSPEANNSSNENNGSKNKDWDFKRK